MRSPDTSAAAHSLQLEVYRRMEPGERVELAWQMSEESRELAAAGVRARHPEYDEIEIQRAVVRLLIGEDLARAVWPDDPLLAP